MSHKPMRPRVRVLCFPDVDSVIGGVKQLYRHVEHLVDLGWDAAIVTESADFRPSWFQSDAPSVSLEVSHKRGDFTCDGTILLLPETYVSQDLSSFGGLDLSSLARVVFNQNAYYSYGQWAPSLDVQLQAFYHDPNVLQVLSISEDTQTFIQRSLGVQDQRISRIVNAIEPIFSNDTHCKNRMHWMPRKNPLDVTAVLMGIKRSDLRHSRGWVGEPLQGITHEEVAKALNSARIFLSFGHPEGFGLPIAEAMAAGCWVVGFSGGGGRELFRFGGSEEVSFGDWANFISAVERAFITFAERPRETNRLLQQQSLAIRTLYSKSIERESISTAWIRVEQLFHHWRDTVSSQELTK